MLHRLNPRRPATAFTLIELLTVIAIIGILAAIGIGVFGSVGRKQVESLTEAQLAVLSSAIEAYRSEFGAYPVTESKVSGKTAQLTSDPGLLLFQCLAGLRDPFGEELKDPDADGIPEPDEKRKPFIDFTDLVVLEDGVRVNTQDPNFEPTNAAANYVFGDGWDQELVYAYTLEQRPGAPSNTWKRFGFLLYSIGFDGLSTGVPATGEIPEMDERAPEDLDNIYAE